MFAMLLSVITWLMPGHLSAALPQQPAQPSATHPAPIELLPGTTLEQKLTGAESHTYTAMLDQDDFLHLLVEQQGVDSSSNSLLLTEVWLWNRIA